MKTRKLRLSAETLRVLSESQARRVVGGSDPENPCEETGGCTFPSWCDCGTPTVFTEDIVANPGCWTTFQTHSDAVYCDGEKVCG